MQLICIPVHPPSRLRARSGWIALVLTLALGVLGGWDPCAVQGAEPAPSPRRGTGPLKVLTTIAPIYSWTAAIACTNASVENLLPSDIGPHDFQFRPRDLKRLESADLILMNGLGLELWLERTLKASATRSAIPRVAVTRGWPDSSLIHELPELPGLNEKKHDHDHDHGHDHDHDGGANPHLWLDPVFARHAVTNILQALVTADPANAPAYQTNAAAYLARLIQLDRDFQQATESWRGRPLVTFHDAFPYFCRRYSLNLVGVVEEVPGTGPSPRHLASLMRVIREQKVRVIFTETQFNPRLARQLASDLSIPVAELEVLETGSLSPTAYEDGQRRNLETLRKLLR